MSMAQPLYTVTILQALAQVLAPSAQARANGSDIEIQVGDAYIGRITIDGPDEWYSRTFKSEADFRRPTRTGYEETAGPFRTPAEAIRSLFAGREPKVKVTGGICGDDQQSSFENSTQQNAGSYLSVAIATRLAIPDYVADEGEKSAIQYLEDTLGLASSVVPGLSFEVQIGPNEPTDEV